VAVANQLSTHTADVGAGEKLTFFAGRDLASLGGGGGVRGRVAPGLIVVVGSGRRGRKSVRDETTPAARQCRPAHVTSGVHTIRFKRSEGGTSGGGS
jgi:hypothetical protein